MNTKKTSTVNYTECNAYQVSNILQEAEKHDDICNLEITPICTLYSTLGEDYTYSYTYDISITRRISNEQDTKA